MITQVNEETQETIELKIYNAHNHAKALALITKYALFHSEDTSSLVEITENAHEYNRDTKILFDFMQKNLFELANGLGDVSEMF